MVAEIEGMHYHQHGTSKPIGELARSAANLGASAVEIADPDEVVCARLIGEIKSAVPGLPVMLGGHTNHENAARRLAVADGAFVGTCLEKGKWGSDIDIDKVKSYVEIVRGIEK